MVGIKWILYKIEMNLIYWYVAFYIKLKELAKWIAHRKTSAIAG